MLPITAFCCVPEHQLQRSGHFSESALDPAELTLFADDFLDKTLATTQFADGADWKPRWSLAASGLRLYEAPGPGAADFLSAGR